MAESGQGRAGRPEWWIPATYALVAGAWIYGSDTLVAAIAGSMERQRDFSVYKGFGFVVVTALLLHAGIRWALRRERADARRIQEAHQFNEQVIRSAQEGVIVYGLDLRYLVWNPFMERMSGVPAEAVLGRQPLDLFPFLQEAGVLERLDRARMGGAVDSIDFPYHFPSTGKSGWATDTSAPLRNASGEIIGVIGMVSDISERRRAEEALRESRATLNLVLDTVPQAIFWKDVEGRYLGCNRVFARAAGLDDPAGIVGRTDFELPWPREEAEAYRADDREVLAHNRPKLHIIERLRQADGTRLWIDTSKSPLRELNGRPFGVLGIYEDITERKLAEEALRKSEEKFSKTFEASPEAICIASMEDGKYLDVNERFLRTTGYQRDEVLGRTSIDLQVWADLADRQRFLDALAGNRFLREHEARFRMKSGELRDFLVTSEIIELEGRPCSLNFLADITERKREDAERRDLQLQLQQAQKMESLGSLAGGVAHDMNNVLGAILGLASANLETEPEGSSARRAFETISKAAQRGGSMVKSLLRFARQGPEERQELDLNLLLIEEIQLLERTTLSRVRLELDLAEALPPIHGDAGAIAHAFMNICVNAVDAMPEGGRLTLRTRVVDADWVEVQVQDSGKGMSQEVLGRAMDPFFTTKDTGKGTGLGLSMVYSTVSSHQGQITLHSQPGEGTLVALRFPVCAATERDPEPPAESRPGPSRTALHVLLVDDDDLIQDTVQSILKSLGHAVTAVLSGEEALAVVEAGLRPEVIILDMNMPGWGGGGTLPRLRALLPAVPVLLATGRPDSTVTDLLAAHPFVSLLSKPFTLGQLKSRLEALHR